MGGPFMKKIIIAVAALAVLVVGVTLVAGRKWAPEDERAPRTESEEIITESEEPLSEPMATKSTSSDLKNEKLVFRSVSEVGSDIALYASGLIVFDGKRIQAGPKPVERVKTLIEYGQLAQRAENGMCGEGKGEATYTIMSNVGNRPITGGFPNCEDKFSQLERILFEYVE